MNAGLQGGGRLAGIPAEPGLAAEIARRMPHLCLGFAALLAVSWWTLAHVPLEQRPPQQPPPPAQQQPAADTSSACDCSGCDVSGCDASACDVCSACDACSGCDLGGIDCVAVPPGAVTHTFEAAGAEDRPRCERSLGPRAWASLGLLLPLAVMFLWRRRR